MRTTGQADQVVIGTATTNERPIRKKTAQKQKGYRGVTN